MEQRPIRGHAEMSFGREAIADISILQATMAINSNFDVSDRTPLFSEPWEIRHPSPQLAVLVAEANVKLRVTAR